MDINTLLTSLLAALATLKPEPAAEYCFLWIQWWPMCMTKAEWSGWMQAIFSVGAILASIYIVQLQHNRERMRERLASGERTKEALDLLDRARAHVGVALDLPANLDDRKRAIHATLGALHGLSAVLESFPLAELRPAHIGTHLLRANSALKIIHSALVTEMTINSQFRPDNFKSQVADVDFAIARMADLFKPGGPFA